MATMDIFNSDAFSTMSMLGGFEKIDYQPSFIRALNIFVPKPVRTESVAIEERDGTLSLIQTDQRGAPISRRTTEKRKLRNLSTVRVAKGDRINASEIQNIRQMGSETELMQVQAEVARRYNGPSGIVREIELTWENLYLGAVQGIVLDADGSTIYNYFTEFGITQADEIDFDLDNASPASGAVMLKCKQVQRQMARAAKGAMYTGIMGICGDTFYDQLTAHSEVRETFLAQQEAPMLRNEFGRVFSSVRYGDILFVNYRGTDDNSTVAVSSTKCKFFPIGTTGVFEVAQAPGESLDVVNTLGRPLYPVIVPDTERNFYVDVEAYSYLLPYCKRPGMLQRARNT